MSGYEKQGTAYDPHAAPHERYGREDFAAAARRNAQRDAEIVKIGAAHLRSALHIAGIMRGDSSLLIGVDRHTYDRLRSMPGAQYSRVYGGDAVKLGDACFGLISEDK